MRQPLDLAHLAQYTGGDTETERQLFATFLPDAGKYLAAMAACDGGEAWFEAAHTLKGAAQGMGAHELAVRAAAAEAMADAPAAARGRMIAELRAALERVAAFVADGGAA